jgi:hypothetical protein
LSKRRKRRRALNQARSPRCIIGLKERVPKERKVDGLIVTPLMERVAIKLVVANRERSEKNIPHVVLLPGPVKNEDEVRVGAKKHQRGKRNEYHAR